MPNNYISEQKNIASLVGSEEFIDKSMRVVNSELIIDILNKSRSSLIFTREYEHQLGLLSFNNKNSLQLNYFEMPHPSGISVMSDGSIFVISTRTPHLLYKFKTLIRDDKILYLPTIIYMLPGSLYAHELYYSHYRNKLVINCTGYNELSTLTLDIDSASYEYFYRPSFFKEKTQNCTQINSYSERSVNSFVFTCFSFANSSYKPWKDEKGPSQMGSLVEINNGKEIELVSNLTCPHSARYSGNDIFFCNSGLGTLSKYYRDQNTCSDLINLKSFTRGLAFLDKYIVVGLSKVLPNRQQYAPKVDANSSRCGLAFIDSNSMQEVASITWENGMQIFDIQIVPNLSLSPLSFPQSRKSGEIEPSQDFYFF